MLVSVLLSDAAESPIGSAKFCCVVRPIPSAHLNQLYPIVKSTLAFRPGLNVPRLALEWCTN